MLAARGTIADKRAMDEVKHCFPPVVDARTRLLVLGSLPGEESLARAQYYANPRNQFWRLIGAVVGADLVPLPYGERLEALLGAGVGLWDMVGSAKRRGSLDAGIASPVANDLAALAARLPALRAIGFNGGKSASLGLAQLAERRDLAIHVLPSSSPAHTLAFAQKLEAWTRLAEHL